MSKRFFASRLPALLSSILLAVTALPAKAFVPPVITVREYASLPYFCKPYAYAWIRPMASFRKPFRSEQDKSIGWRIGVWHYCKGSLLIQRSERGHGDVEEGLKQVFYSLTKARPDHPWLPEMLITAARGYRQKGDAAEAVKYLDRARELQPDNPALYTVWAAILFDQQKYKEAVELLSEGDRLTGGNSGELAYFLGLAYYRLGDMERATEQQERAEALGYPLKGLAQLISGGAGR